MRIQVVEREFVYHGAVLADPNPKFSIEEVRSFYATQFPELTNAAITGPEMWVNGCATIRTGNWIERLTMTNTTDKQSLLTEIRESEGKQANASPLASLIRKFLECPDSQQASSTFARALSLQGSGDPVYPQSGIWPIPPA